MIHYHNIDDNVFWCKGNAYKMASKCQILRVKKLPLLEKKLKSIEKSQFQAESKYKIRK
jgi:hypothetical protein